MMIFSFITDSQRCPPLWTWGWPTRWSRWMSAASSTPPRAPPCPSTRTPWSAPCSTASSCLPTLTSKATTSSTGTGTFSASSSTSSAPAGSACRRASKTTTCWRRRWTITRSLPSLVPSRPWGTRSPRGGATIWRSWTLRRPPTSIDSTRIPRAGFTQNSKMEDWLFRVLKPHYWRCLYLRRPLKICKVVIHSIARLISATAIAPRWPSCIIFIIMVGNLCPHPLPTTQIATVRTWSISTCGFSPGEDLRLENLDHDHDPEASQAPSTT